MHTRCDGNDGRLFQPLLDRVHDRNVSKRPVADHQCVAGPAIGTAVDTVDSDDAVGVLPDMHKPPRHSGQSSQGCLHLGIDYEGLLSIGHGLVREGCGHDPPGFSGVATGNLLEPVDVDQRKTDVGQPAPDHCHLNLFQILNHRLTSVHSTLTNSSDFSEGLVSAGVFPTLVNLVNHLVASSDWHLVRSWLTDDARTALTVSDLALRDAVG